MFKACLAIHYIAENSEQRVTFNFRHKEELEILLFSIVDSDVKYSVPQGCVLLLVVFVFGSKSHLTQANRHVA